MEEESKILLDGSQTIEELLDVLKKNIYKSKDLF